MSEQKRERGIKVMTKKRIWIDGDDGPKPVQVGEVLVLSKEQVKHYGAAVTRDVPDADDD